MSGNELAAKIKALSPQQRQMVESFIESLAGAPPASGSRDLTNHPAFGAWAGRQDLASDSDAAARELRQRAARRDQA